MFVWFFGEVGEGIEQEGKIPSKSPCFWTHNLLGKVFKPQHYEVCANLPKRNKYLIINK